MSSLLPHWPPAKCAGEDYNRVIRVLQASPEANHAFGVGISPDLDYSVPPELNEQVVALLKDLMMLGSHSKRGSRELRRIPPQHGSS